VEWMTAKCGAGGQPEQALDAVHTYCLEHHKLIVNNCPDGTSVCLMPLKTSGTWASYVVEKKLFEHMRKVVIKEAKLPLVLDLDHTLLVYDEPAKRIIGRPGLAVFLRQMAALFQLHVYTQAVPKLAEQYVSFLNQQFSGGNEAGTVGNGDTKEGAVMLDLGTTCVQPGHVHIARRRQVKDEASGRSRWEMVDTKDLEAHVLGAQSAAAAAPYASEPRDLERCCGLRSADMAGGSLIRAAVVILDDQCDSPDIVRHDRQVLFKQP
jgi:hypothetical protein